MSKQDEGLWIRSDLSSAGEYLPAVTYQADHSWPLDDPGAYAYDVAAVVTTAQHDAALVRLLKERVGMALNDIGHVLMVLRGNAGREPVEVLPGMRMTPGVNERLEPFVSMEVDGADGCQIDPPDLMEHATAALQAGRAAVLDGKLHEILKDRLDLDGADAAEIIMDLSEFWPTGAPRRGVEEA